MRENKIENVQGWLKVDDKLTAEAIAVDENVIVKETADLMDKNEISCVIAVRKSKAVGIVTERHLLKQLIAEAKNANKTEVAEVILSPLEVVMSGSELEEAMHLMFGKKIMKLLVTDKYSIMGLVSLTDIARCQPAMIRLKEFFCCGHGTSKSTKKF